jgi:hypothetical protein
VPRTRTQRTVVGSVAAGALLVAALGAATGGAHAEESPHRTSHAVAGKMSQTTATLQRRGEVNLRQLSHQAARRQRIAPATANPATEIPPQVRRESQESEPAPVIRTAPNPATRPLVGGPNKAFHFQGLNIADTRFANGGNQFTNEPPDQGLCVGSGFAMEAVNTVFTVFDTNGAQLTQPVAFNELFGFAPEVDRDNVTFGPSSFDPVCLYDGQIHRWILLVTELDVEPISGALTGGSHLYFAVSQSVDPLGDYTRYVITTTNGDATDVGCPCFDDFPHIGADANGLYITSNRFQVFGDGFNGAQVYALSKRLLARNASGAAVAPTLVSINAGPIDGHPSFTVQPAAVPPGGTYTPDREYFLSTTDSETLRAKTIGVWALSNTDSLNNPRPAVRLTRRAIPSLAYVFEPNARQKPGIAPLANAVGEPLNSLDSGSDMSEVEFAGGRLWGAIGTAVGGSNPRDGVLWLQVRPEFVDGHADGTILKQGYLAVDRDNLMYPAIGVNNRGQGAMVMSVAGPTVYPSPAFIPIDRNGVKGPVTIPEFGARPDDGFTCYAAEVGSRDRGCRWGDYSAATADSLGRIWMATEWISSGPRVPLANWSTQVIRYTPTP